MYVGYLFKHFCGWFLWFDDVKLHALCYVGLLLSCVAVELIVLVYAVVFLRCKRCESITVESIAV